MPYDESRAKYRASAKGKFSAKNYAKYYYHAVLKHKPQEILNRRTRNSKNHYLKNYGLTFEQANEMKRNGCSLCSIKIGKMNIDHDHKTGKVRGVLCNPCNLMIGWMEKAEPRMSSIKRYLRGNDGSV